MSSAILSADDLNDFISPGVACIKPVETLPKTDDSNPYEVTTEDKVQAQNPVPASISLTDCLACSGCVTSAEAVLVSLQSHNEVLNTLDNHPSVDVTDLVDYSRDIAPDAKVFVASVSPQVRASIAATFGLSERRAGRLIEQFLSGSQGLRLGGNKHSAFNYVFDTNRMREACLVLGADEVAHSLSGKSQTKPVITSACPGWVCYVEKTHPHVLPHLSALKSPQALSGTLIKSVLSKRLGIHPSQIWHLALMPCFDKKLEASREEFTDRWWRESNPSDTDSTPIRDVDCVITSREFLSLASARDINLASLIPLTDKPLSHAQRQPFPDPAISQFLLNHNKKDPGQRPEAATSGGYLHHILMSQQSLYPGSSIKTTRGRNNDVTEYSLVSAEGKPLLKCARYYGFRNIQNLVRKLNPTRASRMPGAANRRLAGRGEGNDYAYVEVMACPGGCTNGGGQIKLEDVAGVIPKTRGEMVGENIDKTSPQSQKEWAARVDEAYFSAESEDSEEGEVSEHGVDFDMNGYTGMKDYEDKPNGNGRMNDDGSGGREAINGIDTSSVRNLLQHWSDIVDIPLSTLCYTTYRKVESDVGKSKKEVSKMGDSARIAAIAGASGGGW
ncbi:Cytosolic Fe-S cluster assembly factor nar1 [Exophiala xenobiotica]|uniref:Cytosolic Fe-S cluster assembly factor NAR1 n=1 Tax=Lithohypha guttulata TaxID=1690604 RepID=A0ABR0JTA1_9EURO|nr:Cytosolic Fe-S cluster assembly factor nar1 [Lithohypha guttulata]KAK5309037.1 Cytosolic Fe-S cluster assembly factor nar1 [Exophiala xenobiotica]